MCSLYIIFINKDNNNMIEIKPLDPLPVNDVPKIFLAGSIEMGIAEDWQKRVVEQLQDQSIIIFNPRRDNWDSSWVQSKDNEQFRQQVEWELNALEKSDYIILYLDPQTKSPISLIEMGLFAQSKKMFIVCPDGFWRKGNIDIVAERYNIPQFSNLEELVNKVLQIVKESSS